MLLTSSASFSVVELSSASLLLIKVNLLLPSSSQKSVFGGLEVKTRVFNSLRNLLNTSDSFSCYEIISSN